MKENNLCHATSQCIFALPKTDNMLSDKTHLLDNIYNTFFRLMDYGMLTCGCQSREAPPK